MANAHEYQKVGTLRVVLLQKLPSGQPRVSAATNLVEAKG